MNAERQRQRLEALYAAGEPPQQAMRWLQDDYLAVELEDGSVMDRLTFERLTRDLGRKPPTRAQARNRWLLMLAVLALLAVVAWPVAIAYGLVVLVLACGGCL